MDPTAPQPRALERPRADPEHPDDAAREGLLAGRPEALRSLVERYERPLLELSARFLTRAEAEDVVTESFTLLWKSGARLEDHRGSLWGYLARIARNRCIDHMRRARSRPREGVDASADRAHPEPGPHDLAQLGESAERLWSAVRELPAPQCEALLGAYAEGRTHAELAAHLALPLGTVKTRIRLGLEALRHKLESLR